MDFMPNPTKAGVLTLILWWLFLFALLSVVQWRSKRAFGLPLAYALALSMIHPIGAFPYALDFYTPRSQVLLDSGNSVTLTYTGLFVALIGFASFVVGVIIRPLFFPPRDLPPTKKVHPNLSTKLPHTLLIMSFVFLLVHRSRAQTNSEFRPVRGLRDNAFRAGDCPASAAGRAER